MNSLQKPANRNERIPQRPRSYSDEATPKAATAATATTRAATAATATTRAATAATATTRAATAATAASSTRNKTLKERIKSAIKSVKRSVIGNKNMKKSQLVSTVEEAVSENLEVLQEEVLADVEKIEKDHPDISKRDKNDDFISQIDDTVKGLVIHLHKALEYTEHTRALFGQEPEPLAEPSQVKVSPQVAKRLLTDEEQQKILFEKVNNLIKVLATYLADDKGKSMLEFSKNNDTPVKYTLTITAMGININYASLNELLEIISSRIQTVIMLCYFVCSNELKTALNEFKKTYNTKPLDIKKLYLNFLNILSTYITGNKNLKYKIDDKLDTKLPKEISTLLNDKSVGGKRNKRKPKKAAKKRKASK
jgi:hypothetical protein